MPARHDRSPTALLIYPKAWLERRRKEWEPLAEAADAAVSISASTTRASKCSSATRRAARAGRS